MTIAEAPARVTFLELELTRRCPLACRHCYNDSGPTVPAAGHGSLTTAGWRRIITEAAGAGVVDVQLIGGEPTAHPDWAQLLQHALSVGLRVEVFSNLVAIRAAWWDVLAQPGVSLATSYYSDDPAQHEAITQRAWSHAKTRANIAEAVRRAIPIRVGIIDVGDGQRVAEAEADLRSLGVSWISGDRLRGIGRGTTGKPTVEELCGRCGRGIAAVTADGDVRPCVMSRWMSAGNVLEHPLAEILTGTRMRELVESIPTAAANPCNPDKTDCKPKKDGGDCQPAEKPACNPKHK